MESRSIHPRNWPGGNGVKSNTCKPRGEKTRKLDRKLRFLNRRIIAWSAMKADVQHGMKKPGSMKGR